MCGLWLPSVYGVHLATNGRQALRVKRQIALAIILATSIGAAPNRQTGALGPFQVASFDGTLSVMTYNVHGLPWPVAWGRPAALAEIAERLGQLRQHGRQPHVVVLQEAFTQQAKAIGSAAGYPYVVDGPSAAMASPEQPDPINARYMAAGTWAHGEGMGKYVGSGLQILSDFPVVGARRMVFPAFACAGFDCLANKGALMVSIRLPGRADRVDIVTTHLNSRHASGVPDDRSIQAYDLQVRYLSDFIRKTHDPARAIIVAGDFNVGSAALRRTALLSHVSTNWTQQGDIDDAFGEAVRHHMPLSNDARYALGRARDWQFYAPGRSLDIELARLDVPFGHAADGSMLSDHVGYTATFNLIPKAVTRIARPTA
jgi:endonuclease/exonuclease/phosphatase family metal-dependent hydrolase